MILKTQAATFGIGRITAFIGAALFAISMIAGSFYMTMKPASAGGPICTWVGAGVDNNWSTAANWTCEEGTVPADGTQLIFPYENADTSTTTLNNDLSAAYVYGGVLFNGECTVDGPFNYNTYELVGADIRVAGDVIAELSTHVGAMPWECRPQIDTALIMDSDGIVERLNMVSGSLDTGVYAVTIDDSLVGTLAGSGAITATGASSYTTNNAGFSGTTTVTNGSLILYAASSLGSSSATLTIGSGGQIGVVMGMTIVHDITVNAGASVPAIIGAAQSGETVPVDEAYAKNCDVVSGGESSCGTIVSGAITFSGDIALSGDLSVEAPRGTVVFTGAITGGGNGIVLYNPSLANDGSTGDLVISASSNGSTSPNGTYSPTHFVTTIADSNSNTILVGALNHVFVNGQRGDVTTQRDGIISGTGQVGVLNSLNGGTIQPGSDGGALSTGDVTAFTDTTMNFQLGGVAAGEFGQLDVTGTVSLSGAALAIEHISGYIPDLGTSFTIIDNDGADAITGTFAGLAQGAEVTIDDVVYAISYVGGSGNDVTLMTTSTPGAPGTAGILASPISIYVALGVIFAGGALLTLHVYSSRKARQSSKKR